MSKTPLVRVKDPADPLRCQAPSTDGQCMNRSEQDSEYCRCHGGRDLTEQKTMHGYLLAKVKDRARLAQVSEELEPVKELRDSIGLLHMMIERRWNAIKDDTELLQACGPLNQMLQNMDRLVNSCHKIEQNLGQLLAKQAILTLAKRMVEVMVEELEGIDNYEEIIDRITSRLIDTIRGADNVVATPTVALPTAAALPPPVK